MKILLIDPPYGDTEIGGEQQNFRGVLNRIPSLGLAYLAAVSEEAGYTARIVDCTLTAGHAGLLNIAQEFKPDIVGITSTTPTFRNAVSVASSLRKLLGKVCIVCGGAHPTACPEDAIEAGAFDFAVIGEGEVTFLDLISHVEQKRMDSIAAVQGIAFKREGKVVITGKRPRVDNLDTLPFPARHLFPPLQAYQPTPASYRKLPLAVIMTSRGCPSLCVFCDRAVFGEILRQRSVANVMTEVEEVISKYGAKEVRFFDDTFALNAAFIEGICCSMKKLRPAIPWTCLTKVTAVNFDMLKMMHDAGCWQVLFGLESGDDDVLERLGKGVTVEENRKAVFQAKKAGLGVRADFLVGTPWETKESLRKTIDFAKKLPLDFAHFNKFVPYPGTVIYKELVAQGHRFIFDIGAYINNQNDFVYVPPGFEKSEYRAMLNKAYKEFYFQPRYVLRRASSIRTFTEFLGQIKGAYSILSLKTVTRYA